MKPNKHLTKPLIYRNMTIIIYTQTPMSHTESWAHGVLTFHPNVWSGVRT